LAIVRRQSGAIPKEYDFPPCPPALLYVWTIFSELSQFRGNTGYGLLPLMPTEIEAWCRLAQQPLNQFEIALVFALDRAFLQCQSKGK
jgi:hypothetical protein